MVREASRRTVKYAAKIDADVQRSRILALKDSMVEQVQARNAELATNEANIKTVVEASTPTIYGHQIPAYLNVGRELFKLSKKFTGTTFTKEADAVCDKWVVGKGLTEAVVTAIAKLYGVTYP